MNFRVAVLVLCASATAASHAAESRFLCGADEQVVFGCTVGKKIAALCASKSYDRNHGYLQYRFGTPKKLELSYPSKLQPPRDTFRLGSTMYSGGGASTIRFMNGGFEYVLFDRTIRTNFRAGEPNNPAFSAGVMTSKGDRRTSLRFCAEPGASIRSSAYDALPRDDYELDVESE